MEGKGWRWMGHVASGKIEGLGIWRKVSYWVRKASWIVLATNVEFLWTLFGLRVNAQVQLYDIERECALPKTFWLED